MRFCQWTCGDMGNCATGALFHPAAFGSSAGIVPFTTAARTATLSCAIAGWAMSATRLIANIQKGQSLTGTMFIALSSLTSLLKRRTGLLSTACIISPTSARQDTLLRQRLPFYRARPEGGPALLTPRSEATGALRHTHP